jgi:nucleolar protein 53
MSTPSVTAPAQPKQPSRKGKKAWRKNVDVSQVQEGLQEVQKELIAGGIVAEKPSEELFALDTTGSKDIQADYRKRHKTLKVDEILNQRSSVPAVSSRKRTNPNLGDGIVRPKYKKTKVSGKEFDRLRAIAYGGDQVQKDVVQIGEAATHDPWAVTEVPQEPQFSFLEKKKPVKEPETLKHAPISLSANGKTIPAVRKPEAGKSYNPLVNDWIELIEREGQKEVEAELKRRKEAQEESEALERQLKAEAEEDAEDNTESAWESEWDGIESEIDGGALNKKRPERKTPSQRNRINRRKEAERQAVHEAKMKERNRQLQRIKELAKSVEEKERAKAEVMALAMLKNDDTSEDSGEEVLRKKRFGKVDIPEAPLEVVLSDELQDSLRLLKPEGNLLKDRFRSMVVRGKVESRRQIAFHKKNKTTVTEKWTYKDWKLK